jgi:predicted transcriptional regulator
MIIFYQEKSNNYLYNVRDNLRALPLESNPVEQSALTAIQSDALFAARATFSGRLSEVQEEMNKLEQIILSKYDDDFSRPLSGELRKYYMKHGDEFRKEFLKDKKALYKDTIREVAKGYIKTVTLINGSHIGLFCSHINCIKIFIFFI